MLDTLVATTSGVVERDVWSQWRLHVYALGSVSHAPTSNLRVNKHDCVHSRLIIGDYGIPLYRFATLPELLGAYRDAMAGHRELHSNGILHRDISFGSVLIAPHVECGIRGMLVDFDYATKDSRIYNDAGRTGTLVFMSLDVLAGQRVTVERWGSGSGQVTFETLKEALDAYVFPGEQRPEHATTAEKQPEPALRHSVLHELESFWLILLWICLKRIGPFTARDNNNHTHWGPDREGSYFIKKFFDETVQPSVLCERRRELFEQGMCAFNRDVVPATPPYFALLVLLVRHIFNVLWQVYYDRASGERDRTEDISLYDEFLENLDICLGHEKVLLWDSHSLAPDYARDEYERRVQSGFYSSSDIPSAVQRILELPQTKSIEPAPEQLESCKRTADDGDECMESAVKKKVRASG